MGTWGIGNFDNDGAADYVNNLVDRLTAMVTVILTDKTRAALDEEGEAVVMPIVGILILLCEQCGAYPPDEGAIVNWRDNYLQIFDNQIDDLAPRGKECVSYCTSMACFRGTLVRVCSTHRHQVR